LICHHALGAHFPTACAAAISRFLYNYFFLIAPQLLVMIPSRVPYLQTQFRNARSISVQIQKMFLNNDFALKKELSGTSTRDERGEERGEESKKQIGI